MASTPDSTEDRSDKFMDDAGDTWPTKGPHLPIDRLMAVPVELISRPPLETRRQRRQRRQRLREYLQQGSYPTEWTLPDQHEPGRDD